MRLSRAALTTLLASSAALAAPHRGRHAAEAAALQHPAALQPAAEHAAAAATPQPAHELVARLNQLFLNGRPAEDVADAGVVIHQFDDSGFNKSTRVSKEGGVASWSPWLPCPDGKWCSKFADRFSTSVLNERAPFAFNEKNGGFIIASDTARRATLCAWATDARAMRGARTCLADGDVFKFSNVTQRFVRREGCVPGCVNGKPGQREDLDTIARGMPSPSWCEVGAPDQWCPWRPHHLRHMLAQQERAAPNDDCAQHNGCRYNELVLNSSVWVAELPHTITAVFELRPAHAGAASPVAKAQARRTHLALLRAFNLTDAQLPLLALDLSPKGMAPPGPFREQKNHLLKGTPHCAHAAAAAAAAVRAHTDT